VTHKLFGNCLCSLLTWSQESRHEDSILSGENDTDEQVCGCHCF